MKTVQKMKFIDLLFFIIALNLSNTTACNQKTEKIVGKKSLINKLHKKIQATMKTENIHGLSIAVIKNKKLIWTQAYGVRNKNNGDSVNTKTLFDAASMSKPVTAYLTLMLYERGKIKLDTPLVNYLPEENLFEDERFKLITARMVLTHTTGLPNWGKKLINEPGSKFGYSGEGYVYLGKVLEKISSMSLHELMQKEIFEPFGMKNSSFDWTNKYLVNGASGHTSNGKVVKKKKFEHAHGAGTMATTAEDYAKFVIALLSGFGLKKETFDLMLAPQVIADNWDQSYKIPNIYWGLGWGIQKRKKGDSFFHMGNNRYWRGYIVANKSTGDGVVYFSNSENGHNIAKPIVKIVIKDNHPGLQLVQ